MNYAVAPFELADIKAPCSWSIYMDMFDVWRQCLSFNSRLLDDLFSEYLFEKFQSYRDKVHCSGISVWHFEKYFMTRKNWYTLEYDTLLEMGRLKNYTFEDYVSANPNITLFTVQKHSDFGWNYNQLHCFLGEEYTEEQATKSLRRSKFWKRRYAKWSECLRDKIATSDLSYNKYLEVVYFIENDDIFQHILNSKSFTLFCKNPNVTWEFLKTRVTNNLGVSLKKRIITLINPNVGWLIILNFCHDNNLMLSKDFWTNYEVDEFTHIYKSYPYLIDFIKFRKHVTCDIISAIFQKPDVPEEIIMSLERQHYLQYYMATSDPFYRILRPENSLMPMFLNINLRNTFKFTKNTFYQGFAFENSNSAINERRHEREVYDDLDFDYHDRIGYSKNINLCLKDIDDTALLHLDMMLFQNPMPLEKLAFLHEVLTPAAIKIQRWYLKHFYRPNSRYVTTTLRNRFNNALQKRL